MVTVSTSARTYHHGDLRAALIDAGLSILAERTVDDLSLREVARKVGVSATAVYRHFPDKGALLHALALAGLKLLGEAQYEAYAAAGGGLKGFNATGAAYVRFAIRHAALFRLIFSTPTPDEVMAKSAAPHDAMNLLLDNAAALTPAGMDPRVYALQCWSIAHGLAMLILDGQVAIEDAMIDTVIDAHAISKSGS